MSSRLCALALATVGVAILAGCGGSNATWQINPALEGRWSLTGVTDNGAAATMNVGPTLLEVNAVGGFYRGEWAMDNYSNGTVKTAGSRIQMDVSYVHASSVDTANHWPEGASPTVGSYSLTDGGNRLAINFRFSGKNRRETYVRLREDLPAGLIDSWAVTGHTWDGDPLTIDDDYTVDIEADGDLTVTGAATGERIRAQAEVSYFDDLLVIAEFGDFDEVRNGTITSGKWTLDNGDTELTVMPYRQTDQEIIALQKILR